MAYREKMVVPQSRLRSAVTNGRSLVTGIDQRSAPARRYKDVMTAIASDLGGMDHLSQAQLHLVRSVAGLVVLRESLDAQVLSDEKIDTAEYVRIANSLRRLLATIGLERVSRDVTPDLKTYIERKSRHRAVDDDDELEDADG